MEMKSFFPIKFLRWLCTAALAATMAHAHEPAESSTVARLQYGRLEMVVTFSAPMATALVAEPGEEEAVGICASTFAAYQPRLLAKAAGLFEVRVDGVALAPLRTSITLNRMGEPEFVLIYPRPETWPVRLRVHYLKELPARFGGIIQVFDENEASLTSRSLTREGEGAEVAVNPVPEPNPLAPVEPVKFAPPAMNPVATRSLPLAPVIAAVAVLLFTMRWMRRGKVAVLLALALSANAAYARREMEKLGRGAAHFEYLRRLAAAWE